MTGTLIDGTSVASRICETLRQQIELRSPELPPPGLATVLIGDDPASKIYVANKRRQSAAIGIRDFHRHIPHNATQQHVAAVINELADDDRVSGILLQLPVPKHLDAAPLIDAIPWYKDVDGLTSRSVGLLDRGEDGLRPCTPTGVLTMLDEYDVDLLGAEAVVVGRSALVGRPLARMLLDRNATVTVSHSRSRDLAKITRRADVLIAAAGVPELIGTEHIKPGAVVIDVGMHRHDSGLVGDVDFAAIKSSASLITPVPGGVGPMTIAELLRNTVKAAALAKTGPVASS